jgi:hypothetical protein
LPRAEPGADATVVRGAPSLAQPLDENHEYYACKLTILNTKTVGTGSCAAASPAAFLVSNIVLHQLPADGDARSAEP